MGPDPDPDPPSSIAAALEAMAGPDGLVDQLTAALETEADLGPASVLDLGEIDNVAAELAAV